MGARIYHIGNSSLEIMLGDITSTLAEVIVSSDDFYLSMGGGVSQAIGTAAGRAFRHDARKLQAVAQPGDVVVTGAGDLSARYVLHAITIGDSLAVDKDVIVRSCTRRAMQMMPMLHCNSIAFPAIGAGTAGIPYEVVAAGMVTSLFECLLDETYSYRVELWLSLDSHLAQSLVTEIDRHVQERFAVQTTSHDGTGVQIDTGQADVSHDSPAGRLAEVYGMLRLLDRRRAELESKVLEQLTSNEGADVADLVRQLRALEELRSIYEPHARPSNAGAGSSGSVFVSSTSLDLQTHRARVREVVEGMQRVFIGMEDFAPSATPPADYIRQRVVESESYVLILGMRYGYVDPVSGLSMTELEYHQAVSAGKPLGIFVMSDDAPVTVNMVERDPSNMARLLEFKGRVLAAHTCRLFTDANDLAGKVQHALQHM